MNAHANITDPPGLHSLDAEIAFLGALLHDNAIADHTEGLTPAHFYDPVHGRIYSWCQSRISKGQLADAVTLRAQADADPGLKEIGGAEYLATWLCDDIGAPAAIEYARIVRDYSERRELAAVCDAIRADLPNESARDLIERTEASLAEITGSAVDTREVTLAAAMAEVLAEVDDPRPRTLTGLTDLDDMLGGFRPGGYYVIAGRSSMGKTALGLECARRVAKKGKSALFVSIEMPRVEVAARLMSTASGVHYRDILRGRISPDDRFAVDEEAKRLAALPLTIMDVPGITVSALRSRIRRWKRAEIKAGREPGIVVVDYLQLIRAEDKGSLYERTSGVSRSIKPMLRELELPGVILCQLSRDSEKGTDSKRPAIRHLRDSGAIEEDADAIMLLFRDSYYAEREDRHDDPAKEDERMMRVMSREVECDVAKNRQGAIGKLSLWADLKTNKFDNWGGR